MANPTSAQTPAPGSAGLHISCTGRLSSLYSEQTKKEEKKTLPHRGLHLCCTHRLCGRLRIFQTESEAAYLHRLS